MSFWFMKMINFLMALTKVTNSHLLEIKVTLPNTFRDKSDNLLCIVFMPLLAKKKIYSMEFPSFKIQRKSVFFPLL